MKALGLELKSTPFILILILIKFVKTIIGNIDCTHYKNKCVLNTRSRQTESDFLCLLLHVSLSFS